MYLFAGYYLRKKLIIENGSESKKDQYAVWLITIIGSLVWLVSFLYVHLSDTFLKEYVWVFYELYNFSILPAFLFSIRDKYVTAPLGVPEWTLILTFIPSLLMWIGWQLSRTTKTEILKTNKANYRFLGIVIAFIVILSVGITLFHEKSQASNNIAWATKSGDWIYYKDDKDHILWLRQYRFYKMKEDGSQRTKVSNDNPEKIRIAGDWLYYINNSDAKKIYRIKSDGTNSTRITDASVADFIIDGNSIYLVKESDKKLYKLTEDKLENIMGDVDNIVSITTDDNWIYTSGATGIYKISKGGTDQTHLTRDRGNELFVKGQYLYFVSQYGVTRKISLLEVEKENKPVKPGAIVLETSESNMYYLFRDDSIKGYKLHRANLDLTQEMKLSDDKAENAIVAGNWIFYNNMNEGGKIYRVSLDGQVREKI